MAAAKSLTASQLSQRARIAAYAKHRKHDPVESTAAARKAFLGKFEDRAELREHMARMAYASSKARAK
jgi:hypothetical protein